MTALQAHLLAHVPKGVTLEMTQEMGGTAANSLPEDHPMLRVALGVLGEIHGKQAFPARAGGSIPITTIFKEMMGIDAMTFGLAMPDDDVHAPNESFRLSAFDEGLRSWPMLFSALGAMSKDEFNRR